MLRRLATAGLVFITLALSPLPGRAYPVLDAVTGLPDPLLVTVYPDDVDPNLYYFVPTTVALALDPATGKPLLGVQYWGLTGLDPNGVGAALTFSVKPAYDKPTVDQVADALKKKNANARFAFPTLVDSSMQLILNGQFFADKQDTTNAQVKAGTVDGTQVFTVGLNGIGAKAFSVGTSDAMNTLGARYTFKFTGVDKRLYAKITVFQKRVYDHFKVQSSATGWWGLVSSSWSADWQSLTSDGSIKIDILEGGETDKDKYMMDIFQAIINLQINGQGMFAPKLQPAGIKDSGGGGGSLYGWSFSGGGGWEHLDETVNYSYIVNTKKLDDREFVVGLSFSAVCAKYPDNFADLTTLGNKCIDASKLANTIKLEQDCMKQKLQFYQGLLDQHLISQATFDAASAKIADPDRLCYPQAGGTGAAHTLALIVNPQPVPTQPAPNQTADDRACLKNRLQGLSDDRASGLLPTDQWDATTRLAFATPCVSEQPSDDAFLQTQRQKLKYLKSGAF